MLFSQTLVEAVKKVPRFYKSTNKGTPANWTTKSPGCRRRKEFGKLTKFYRPNSGW